MTNCLSTIDIINHDIAEAVSLTRSLSVDLSPPVLGGEGLVEALGWLASQMQQRHGLTLHLEIAEELPVPHPNLRVLLFQTVREALFNVVKHTGVSEARVTLHYSAGQLRIEVIDEGYGFDVEKVLSGPQRSQGLWQNQRRLKLVGGEMVIESSSATGTRVILTCPIPDTA
ncbi:MAG: ATP-binding protein [Caldilineaceae bacterium]